MFSPLNNTRAFYWGKDRDNGVPISPVPTRNSSVRCRRNSRSSSWWWWNIAHLQGKLTDAFVLYSKLQVSRHTRVMYTMDYCLAIENCSLNYGRKICAKTASAKSSLLKMSTVSVFPILTAAIVQMSVALETPSLDPKKLRTLLTVVVQQFEQPKNHFLWSYLSILSIS